MRAGKGAKGGTIIFPNTTTLGNVEVNHRITAAFTGDREDAARRPASSADFKVDAGPENIGIDVDANDDVNSVVTLIESRKDVVGAMAANGFVTPALGDAMRSCTWAARSAPSASTSGRSSRSRSRPVR